MKRLTMYAAPFICALLLAACSGNSSPSQSGSVLPQAGTNVETSFATTALPATQTVGSGEIFGTDNMFSPNDGDTASGGHGSTIDGIACNRMAAIYHVHFFVGIIINGQHLALPDGIGMSAPTSDFELESLEIQNWTESSGCYYYLHTHDASGVIHVESPVNAPKTSSLYTLGNAFDIWGMKLSSSNIGSHTGTVTVYVAQPPLKTDPVSHSLLKLYTSNPRSIPIHSHTVVWLELGSPIIPPSGLSNIQFYEEY